MSETLRVFAIRLWAEPPTPLHGKETWEELLARIATGGNHVVTKEVYFHYLEVEPPFYLGEFGFIAACEGTDPVRWFLDPGDGRYLCRQLSDEETITFCHLAGIALPEFWGLRSLPTQKE